MLSKDIKDYKVSNNTLCDNDRSKNDTKDDVIQKIPSMAEKDQAIHNEMYQSTKKVEKGNVGENLHSEGCLCLKNKRCLHDMHPFLND